MYKTKHYIRINEKNHIVHCFSEAFEQPQESDICITEEGGRHFELLGEINPSLKDENGIHLYKYTDKVEKRTQEEMQADLDIINAKPKTFTEIEQMWDVLKYFVLPEEV